MNSADPIPEPDPAPPIASTPAVKPGVFGTALALLAAALFTGLLWGAIAAIGFPFLIGGGFALFGGGGATFFAILAGIVGGISGALYGMFFGAFVGPIWSFFKRPNGTNAKKVGRRRLIRAICLASAMFLAAYFWSAHVNTLPAASEIQSMTAALYGLRQEARFSVPSDHIALIMAEVSSATVDYLPMKWEVLGLLEITRKNGRKTRVGLYRTHRSVGAFSIESEDPRSFSRIYFRGGSDMAIENAINNARTNAK